MSHTPGPWCLSPLRSYVRRTLHGFNICQLNEMLEPDEVNANADLIAAAPDLLEALREFVDDVMHPDHECCDWSQTVVLDKAQRAIAKAEGRS